MEGWIKLYRKFCSWEWYNISEMVHLFIHILLNANHEDGEWRGIKIKRGQLITGRNSLSENTGISQQTIRTCLHRLKSTNEITIKPTNKYSIITICNYESYQIINGVTNQQINQLSNQELTSNQPATNHKQEDKEDKNIKTWKNDFDIYLKECKEGYADFMKNIELIKTQERLNPGINVKLSIEKGFTNYWSKEAGWMHKKKSRVKTINWETTIINSIGLNKVYYTKAQLEKL
jgi:hypothetical protein